MIGLLDNDIRLFKIYKKMPTLFKNELALLITPENILHINTSALPRDVISGYEQKIEKMLTMSYKDLKSNQINDYNYIFMFNNFIKIFKDYLILRPNLFETNPELLI